MPNAFLLYKPFRNQLRRLELIDSLQLIWGFSRNLIFDLPVPEDIELPSTFRYGDDVQNRRLGSLSEFELEFLIKEIIINCSTVRSKKSLKKIKTLSKLVNYLRNTLDNEITKEYSNNIFIEFNRIAHRQFNWQMGYHTSVILRYYKLYTHRELIKIFDENIGLPPYELFIIGFVFFIHSGKNFCFQPYKESNIPKISIEMVNKFLEIFSIQLDELKKELKTHQQINENLFYTYNPLVAKPLIIIDDYITCPIPLFIYWKLTSGLYYSLVGKKGFENSFGNAFQDYVGEVIRAANITDKIQILPEEIFGKQQKRTTDWILTDQESLLFLECKTKRLTLQSKTILDTEKGLRNDIITMANFIVQTYKTYLDYQKGLYPTIKYDSSKQFYPAIITLEEWFLTLNPELNELLYNEVITALQGAGLNIDLVDKHPYYIFSIEQFERFIQTIGDSGISSFFDRLKTGELSGIEYKNLFEGEVQRIFFDPLGIPNTARTQ